MNILNKLKETAISVFPVMGIVFLLSFTIVPLDKTLLIRFFIGGFLLILGLTIFLLGVDLGIQPMGQRCGSALTQKRNLSLLLISSFLIGFIVTAAEPDIQVFATQIKSVFPFVNKGIITFVIAGGVGIFMLLGILRSVLNFSIKITILISYSILFILSFFAPDSFFGIAFDSGGATTGPMTVPFIMALGLGVSSVRDDENNSFGLTGIASIGPVMAVIIYSLFIKTGTVSETMGTDPDLIKSFSQITTAVLKEVVLSILPLLALFFVFQLFLLKMTARQVIRLLIGFVYSFVGLSIFLIGVNCGFMQAGQTLGELLGALAFEKGGIWYFVLILVGLVLGAIIVCAEPAVWILSEQVETVSGGTIKRKMLMIFLSIGTALAIGISMIRAVTGFNLKWILIPGYIIAMVLMIFCPPLFSGIAFDSGGVASGPLTSTFILSFALGAGSGGNGGQTPFGVIALVAMMPLIAIQIMGIIVKIKKAENKGGGK